MTSVVVAVTGASGFLARALISRLLDEGVDVRGVTRAAHLADDRVECIQADIRDPVGLLAAFRGVDAVFHLAAHVHDVHSIDDTAQQQAITLGGTRAVLEAAGQAGVGNVVFASSLAVFGSVGHETADERHPCLPDSPYGRAKLESEVAVAEFAARTGAYAACIRPAMMYGVPCPGNLPRLIRAVASRWFPTLPEFGNRRSMVSVTDAAAALMLAWRAKIIGGRAFIVTDDESYSTRQVVELIRAALGRPEGRLAIPRFLFSLGARAGDVARSSLGRRIGFDRQALARLAGSAHFDPTRARAELGFAPTTTLPQIMPALVEHVVGRRAASAGQRDEA